MFKSSVSLEKRSPVRAVWGPSWTLGLGLALTLTCAPPLVCQAQTGAPLPLNPPTLSNAAPPIQLNSGESPAAQVAKLKAWQQAQREQNMRDYLTRNGFTDAALQNAVVDSAARQEAVLRQARIDVLEAKRLLYNALTARAVQVDAVAQATLSYETALDTFKKQRAAIEEELARKVSLLQNPKLKGLLLLVGIVGEAAPFPSAWGVDGTASGRESQTEVKLKGNAPAVRTQSPTQVPTTQSEAPLNRGEGVAILPQP